MIIRSSNLCLRFYKKDGWNTDLMDSFAEGYYQSSALFGDSLESSYFVINPGSEVDIEKLLELKTELVRGFDDYPEQTDEEFIKDHI